MAGNELGAFLRARRAQISPLDVGRAESARRRVPGLRRGEVAELAQISVEYYVELEQGRGRNPSDQVVAALARALRLDHDERDYLFRLAGIAAPSDHGPGAHVEAAVLSLLDHLTGIPAQLFTDLYELVAQNDLAVALLDEPLSTGPEDSQVRRWFLDPDTARARYPLDVQPGVSRAYVADLRATSGRRPHDRRVNGFVERLRAGSAEFSTLWNEAAVRVRRSGSHQVRHPALGVIDLECTGMLSEDGRQRLVWYSPQAGGEAAEQLRLLTVVGTTAFTDRPS
ncbi:helix-turn-helix transcriptional regulator [Streptomyces sp. TS71-3]|uniref:helix-turn-helix transcriptional regulator n=1 Tax=Streptomyces sp. TS71-3 TaxID=2733862 RepID=UPI001B2222CA|nr:helix-turn-helix transcriptional regulator [Streptomyces sp. TS71-3]GHJ37340.1 DNA-binding protein [Streptomyces sp. TS71-3]